MACKDTEQQTGIDPPSSQASLSAPPGTLNDINTDDADFATISNDQSGWSILKEAVRSSLSPNKLKNAGMLKGILLQVDNPYEKGGPVTSQDTVNMSTNSMKGSNKYKLPTYKIRVPELHFPLPVPFSVRCVTPQDQRIIDCYPVVQAANRFAAKAPVVPGDLVWVEIINGDFGLAYLGPVDSEGMIRNKSTGASPLPQGRCLEECIKKYPNRGARGDSISNFGNLSKPNTGLPPLISGEGISESRIIPGIIHKKWLVERFRQLQSAGSYRGLVWLGVCKHNGPEDDVGMLSDDGKRVAYDAITGAGGKPGRSTVIYMPIGTDPTSELEIIYWFHGGRGFKNGTKEWQDLWSSSLKEMSKKKRTLDGKRRNFVFVAPEMLWSEQGSDAQGVPRRQSQITSGSAGSFEATTYQDRQWAAWGFTGQPSYTPSFFGATPVARDGIPYSFKEHDATLEEPGVAGDMIALHDEVLGILENHFNLTNRNNVKYLTLVAEHKGGPAISNLSRLGILKKLNPTKIVLAHCDHSSIGPMFIRDHPTFGNTALPLNAEPRKGDLAVRNRYHDNDLYEIIRNVDQNNPPQIEVHLTWGTTAGPLDGKGQGLLPRQAFGAFLGATFQSNISSTSSTFKSAVDKLKNIFYRKKMATGTWKRMLYYKDDGAASEDYAVNQAKLSDAYEDGYSYISGKQLDTIRLAPPFNNIVYKGWPGNNIKGAVGWLPLDKAIKSEAVEVTLAKDENTLLGDPNISDSIKNVFRDFDGSVILYSSDFVGPSKTVAILSPDGTDPTQSYEIIYYLHGDIGLNGAAKTYTHALQNQIRAMANRNVIIVLMDIDPYPFSSQLQLWNDGGFNDFHEEVYQRILEYLTIPDEFGLTYLPERPKFFTIKAHGGGSRMLSNAMKNLKNEYIGPTGGLTRIDLLDANWGIEWSILDTINSNKWKSKVTLGQNFEVQVVAGPKTFGPMKISVKEQIKQLENIEGVWTEEVNTTYNSMPYTYFSAKNKLSSNSTPTPLPTDPAEPTYIDLIFDKYGQAYLNGARAPGYDLKIARGILKNHIPSTEQVGQVAECETDCFQARSTTKGSPTNSPIAQQDCKKNPLGLIKYETSQFSSIIVHPKRTNFSWGTKKMGEYLKGLDDPLWLKTKISGISARTQWVIKDISPKKTNGIDKVQGHKSHREGIDVNIILPQNDIAVPTLKRITSAELDIDKTLIFMILSRLHGAKIIFLDKKFFRRIEDRAMFIANDGPGTVKTDSAFKLFFKKHLFGKPYLVKELMRLLQHERAHEDHFQVRITRKWASHETKDHPKWALHRLKKLGCNYQSATAA